MFSLLSTSMFPTILNDARTEIFKQLDLKYKQMAEADYISGNCFSQHVCVPPECTGTADSPWLRRKSRLVTDGWTDGGINPFSHSMTNCIPMAAD